jgi:hypothetical protein
MTSAAFNTPFDYPFPNPTTPGQIFSNQQAFCQYLLTNTNTFIDDVLDTVIKQDISKELADNGQEYANPDFVLAEKGIKITSTLTPPKAPTLEPLSYKGQKPLLDKIDNYKALPDVAAALPAAFNGVAPVSALTPGDVPTRLDAQLPTAPNTDTNIATPPEFAFPDLNSTAYLPPVLQPFNLPDAPNIQKSNYQAYYDKLPVVDVIAPTNQFQFTEQDYNSPLLTALEGKLLEDMNFGGYGIEDADEAQLVERARARESAIANAEIEETYRVATRRGFALPPADALVFEQRALQKLADRTSEISREVYLKRNELYVENRKFTIEQARQLESTLINYHNSVMERALNAAKSIVQLGIEAFNASVAAYNLKLERWKVAANLQETQNRADLTLLEEFRIKVDAERIKGEARREDIELYKARLSTIDTRVNLYKVNVEAATIRLNQERLKTEVFRAQVDMYLAQVQAKRAEFDLYNAQINSDIAKSQAFESEVKAYITQVEGARLRLDFSRAELERDIAQNKAKMDKFEIEYKAYLGDLDGQLAFIKSQSEIFSTEALAFNTDAAQANEVAKLELERMRVEAQQRFKAVDVVIENARIKLAELLATKDLQKNANAIVGDYTRTGVGQALQSINSLITQAA